MQQYKGLVGAARFLKSMAGSKVYPMVVMFADVRTRKHRTNLQDVLKVSGEKNNSYNSFLAK